MNAELLKALEKLDLPFPWETNRQGQIIMTPGSYDHSIRVGNLIRLFAMVASDWHAGTQLGILTSDGLKAPDVILAGANYHAKFRGYEGFVPEAPEICVEVMSPSNSWQEMRDKVPLYFETGALEVWIVDTDGRISFFAPGGEALEGSRLIAEMPGSI
jgi:Uma2 family endonuclease